MTLAEVLAAHRWSPSLTSFLGGCFGCAFHGDYGQFVAHHVEAVAAAGLAVVELPKQTIIPTGWRDDCLGCWPSGLGERAFEDPVSAWPGGEGISLPGGEFMPADRARVFAAALLAAADAAEHPGTPVGASQQETTK